MKTSGEYGVQPSPEDLKRFRDLTGEVTVRFNEMLGLMMKTLGDEVPVGGSVDHRASVDFAGTVNKPAPWYLGAF